jgi:hypothetical protein
VNRRDFLRAATAAAVAPMIVPRHVIAGSQVTPPSDRITVGHIGVGRMGGGHVRGFLKMPARTSTPSSSRRVNDGTP